METQYVKVEADKKLAIKQMELNAQAQAIIAVLQLIKLPAIDMLSPRSYAPS